jgi:4-methoxybenzoate monooxygenase (O-demethylating)
VPETMQAGPGGAPACALDPFADGFLRDPFAFHTELREAGPVVWLEQYGIWAMARYAEVHEALRDWETYSSAAGVGLSDFRKEKPWRPPSLLLEADPPEHARARKAVARAMSPRTIAALRQDFAREADSLAAELLAHGTVDGVTEIAEAYPLRVFPRAVGITQDCREQLLAYGNMAFNAFGPRNQLQADSMAQVQGVAAWIAAHCAREALTPGGLGDRIYASADEGTVTEDEAALGHVGFGYGIHACVGAAFARLEGEVLLQALARRVESLEPAGEPRRRLNNTLSGFASLPLTLRARG